MTDWPKVKFFEPGEWGRWEKVSPELIYLMDEIRGAANIPINIHCAYEEGGHSDKSYHYVGLAVDFHFIRNRDFKFQYSLLSTFLQIGGLGFYPEWNNPGWHVDLRGVKQRLCWVRSEGRYIYGPDVILRRVELIG